LLNSTNLPLSTSHVWTGLSENGVLHLQDLRDDERVRAQLNAALNAMHGAGSAAGAQPQADYCAAAPQPDAAADGAAAGEPLNLRASQRLKLLTPHVGCGADLVVC